MKSTAKNEQTKSADEKSDVVIFTVVKPDQDKHGSGAKIARMKVLFKFISKVTGIKYFDDQYVLQIAIPDEPGDAIWFRDNVLRYVDIDNSGQDMIVEAKADKLVEMYHLKDPDNVHKVGLGILKFNVEEMYMKMSIWKVE